MSTVIHRLPNHALVIMHTRYVCLRTFYLICQQCPAKIDGVHNDMFRLCEITSIHTELEVRDINLCKSREYRIALIFRGSKISRKAVFDIFVEIISRKSSAHPHA